MTDANKGEIEIAEEIMLRVLKLKHSKGPSRPQRIILMGTPGCGKEKFAQRIAEEHQLVYIQVTQLLKDAVRRDGPSTFA
jgi:ATP-dependent 26S proteasome regulatory subunit